MRCSLHGLPDVRSTHGPEAADQLVAGILDVVRRRLRGTDVVAYVGDHEIAALLAHADMDAANTTADAIREAAEGMRVQTARGLVGTDAESASRPGGRGLAGARRRRRAGDAGPGHQGRRALRAPTRGVSER